MKHAADSTNGKHMYKLYCHYYATAGYLLTLDLGSPAVPDITRVLHIVLLPSHT